MQNTTPNSNKVTPAEKNQPQKIVNNYILNIFHKIFTEYQSKPSSSRRDNCNQNLYYKKIIFY